MPTASLPGGVERFRREFPIVESCLYLDHAGVSPVPLRTVRRVRCSLDEACREAAFRYDNWLEAVEGVRSRFARLLGASADEVAFTKNTSHGISLVARGLQWRTGEKVLVAGKDFPANVYPWLALEKRGVEVRRIPLNREGGVDTEDVRRMLDGSVRLVALSSVLFWNGYRVPLDEIGPMCRERGVLLFVDAIQSLGVVPIDVERMCIDFLAADGHKWLLAPEGTGVFYCRRELAAELEPPLLGWKSVVGDDDYDTIDFTLKPTALRFEEGSTNVMGVVALGASLELLEEYGVDAVCERVLGLGELVMEEAVKRRMVIHTPRDRRRRAGIVSLRGDFSPHVVREALKGERVMVNVRGGALRVSPHFYNTPDDVARLFEAIDRVLRHSPG